MAHQNVRNRYVSDGAGVVPPARLLVMLYDRLVLDLEHADAAILTRDIATANDKLVHAQAIILELHSALDPSAWDGAENLAQLYMWFNTCLLDANVKKDVKPLRQCMNLVKQLQSTWHEAYKQVLAAQTSPALQAATPTA